MKEYFRLQLKRVGKVLPVVLIAMIVLIICMLIVFSELIVIHSNSEDKQKTHIALCGDIKGTYLEFGLEAVKALDSTRFSIDLELMEQDEAIRMLEAGKSSACVVIPEDFAYEVYNYGRVLPITYITSGDNVGMAPLLKEELTTAIGEIMSEGMRSIYGSYYAVSGEDVSSLKDSIAESMMIEYLTFVFNRTQMYSVEYLGFADGQSLTGYLVCGLSVVLLMLLTLPFAILFIRQDNSLQRIMHSKGNGALRQILSEFGAFFIGMLSLFLVICACVFAAGAFMNLSFDEIFATSQPVISFVCSLLVVLMLCSLSFCVYEISRDIVSGVLSMFFVLVFLCYTGGCIYPNFIFPETLQKITSLLPTAVGRIFLSECTTGEMSIVTVLCVCLYTGVFLTLSVVARNRKLNADKG